MANLGIVSSLKSCLDRVLVNYPVKLAYLYGSTAAGNATPLSDIDIALVLSGEPIAPEAVLTLELQVANDISIHCETGAEVDVRVINEAPIMFRGEVITNGILLFSSDEEFRVEFETFTRRAYFDFLPAAAKFRQEYLNSLSERGGNGQSRENF